MRRVVNKRRSKKALTLVELVVAMALTMIFMGACVMLVYPVERIYTHTNDLSRAQLVADSVVNSLRAECTMAAIEDSGDLYIVQGDGVFGDALYFRRSNDYIETIASNYVIPQADIDALRTAQAGQPVIEGVENKAVFRLNNTDVQSGYVHFGYYALDAAAEVDQNAPSSWTVYDYTNPFSSGTYNGFQVRLDFSYDSDVTDYVLCDVTVLKNGEAVYTRNTILCFA